MTEKTPPAPPGTSANARRVWRSVLADYDLRGDEIELLRHLVGEITLVETLEKAWKTAPEPLVRGSHGGTVANPILAEIRQHRAAVVALWKALRLPDVDEEPADQTGHRPMSRSEAGRKAALARWRRPG